MITKDEALSIVRQNLNGWSIQKFALHNGKFVFMVFSDDPDEGQFDPFYSVDASTGEFSGYPLMLDNNLDVLDLMRPV